VKTGSGVRRMEVATFESRRNGVSLTFMTTLPERPTVVAGGDPQAPLDKVRDDTVPWVKRLTRLLQEVDPSAMRGDFGSESVATVADSPYFGPLERKNIRNWVPITRAGLVKTVERRPSVAQLDPEVREQLLHDVGRLYDTSARVPDPLLLPFQTSCWRAQVDHSKMAIDDDLNDVLQITL